MRKPDYNSKALAVLARFYKDTEIEKFGWYPDYEDEEVFELRFIDSMGLKRKLSLNKKTMNPTLKNM